MPSTPYEVVTEYLTSIGVSPKVLPLLLYSAKYEEPICYYGLAKTNILACNRHGISTNQSHIHIHKPCWFMFFSDAEISDFEKTGNTHEAMQHFRFFEANISHMLSRRLSSVSSNSLLIPKSPKNTYSLSDNCIIGTATKWINDNDGSTQVRLHRIETDSDTFWDFRLGIQIDDYWFLFKNRYNEEILLVSIPHEFVSRFNIINNSKITTNKTAIANRLSDLSDDAFYIAEAAESEAIIVPEGPSPRPSPVPTSSGLKYKPNPRVGKQAIRLAYYTCELSKLQPSSSHSSFAARSTSRPYMEPHHLIPISKQGLFDCDIDKPSNIVCLCPLCHKKIHYGERQEVKQMLTQLLLARIDRLRVDGIEATEDDLFAFYDI